MLSAFHEITTREGSTYVYINLSNVEDISNNILAVTLVSDQMKPVSKFNFEFLGATL